MAFIERRLLECVAYGTSGGPTWMTRKIGLRSGVTRRNPLRSRPMYRFNVLYRNLLPADHNEVISAFNACMGGVHSFRLKDWADYQAVDELLPVLGTGGIQNVQLIKNYDFDTQSLARSIRKPVVGTVTLTADGAPLTASIDYATGIATFTAGASDILRWSGEFDVPVMFESDELLFSGDDKGVNGLFLTADVPLVEDFGV